MSECRGLQSVIEQCVYPNSAGNRLEDIADSGISDSILDKFNAVSKALISSQGGEGG